MGNNRSKLNPETLESLKQRSKFTEEELFRWYDGLGKDVENGFLTYELFQNIFQRLFPQGDGVKFGQIVFGIFDENKDQKIDFEEFVMALNVITHGTREEKLNWAFRLYDFNNDGLITKSELLNILKAIYSMVGKKVTRLEGDDTTSPSTALERIFELVDTDGNSLISFDEFLSSSQSDKTIRDALSLYDGIL